MPAGMRYNQKELALKSAAGSYAMEFCEPRQVREEAAVSEPFRVP